MVTYFKDENHKSKKKYENYKTLTSNLEAVDTVVIIGTTTNCVTLLVTGVGLTVAPISAQIDSALSLGNKIIRKKIINKDNEYKKQNQNDQQTTKSFDEVYSRSLRDDIFDEKTKMNIYVIILLSISMEQKVNLFHKYED